MLKAAAFDLDDTLLHSDLSISPYTIQVFRRLRLAGFHLIAASGRAHLSMKPFADMLSCVSLCVACNGAEIWDGQTDALLCRETYSADVAREIAAFANEYNCYAQTYEGDRFYYNRQDRYAAQYAAASMLKGELVGDLVQYINEPRTKILLINEADVIARLLPVARRRFEGKASVTCSKPIYLEFNPPRATKGIALETCSRILNIPLSDFVAFGDSLNDLSMLQAAGCSVAVSNGWEEIKNQVDDICASNEEDGVAHYLSRLFSWEEI